MYQILSSLNQWVVKWFCVVTKYIYEKEVNIGQNAAIKFCLCVFRKIANNYVLRLIDLFFLWEFTSCNLGQNFKGWHFTLHVTLYTLYIKYILERKVEDPSLSNI